MAEKNVDNDIKHTCTNHRMKIEEIKKRGKKIDKKSFLLFFFIYRARTCAMRVFLALRMH